MNKKARLDADKTAKPLTSLIVKPQETTHIKNMKPYHELSLINNETGEEISFYQDNKYNTYIEEDYIL